MNSASRNESGFTLIEVLISMAILVFISFAIYQATVETYKLRDSLSAEGDFYGAIQLSMNILQRDISLIYSPTISLPDSSPSPTPPNTQANGPVNPQQMQLLTADDLSRSTTFWSAATDISGLRPSHFVGREDKLSFVALSHLRIYKDSTESEFAKITYELQKDEGTELNPHPDTLMLVKTETPNAFANDDYKDTFKHTYTLLHGIKSFRYTYYQMDGNTWKANRDWDSDREETKNKYPQIIELKLEVLGPSRQSFEGKFKFRPEIPLNGLNPST